MDDDELVPVMVPRSRLPEVYRLLGTMPRSREATDAGARALDG